MGHAEYPGSRFWLLSKRQELLDYRKATQERKCQREREGKKHLGAATGSQECLEEYASGKVSDWISEVAQLTEFP